MCGCIERVNKTLVERKANACVRIGFERAGGLPRMMVAIHGLDKRRASPVAFLAKCCPICGEAYPEEEETHGAHP